MTQTLKYTYKNSVKAISLTLALTLANIALAGPLNINEPNRAIEQVDTLLFSEAEIDQMLAPIALYPDTLLTHILIAATYPLEVIEASRLIAKNQNASEQELFEQAALFDWDPSVKALIPFPRILENLSNDIAWMTKLGDAFLQDESQVLASIQNLRTKADDAGNLSAMDNVKIVREQKVIIIEPAKPEIIYVPYYDTRVVYGNWHWRTNPPVYWHRPYYSGPTYWNSSVYIGFNFFFSAFHWHNHHVVRHHHNSRYHHSSKRIATSHHAKRWQHNVKHRKGVAYRSKQVKHRYHSKRPSVEHSRNERKTYNHRVVANKSSHHGAASSRVILSKQQQVAKRLQRNKAIQVNNGKEGNVNRHKGYVNNKTRSNVTFVKAPGRIADKRPIKNNRADANHTSRTNTSTNKTFYRDTWKKQQRVEPIEHKRLQTPKSNQQYVTTKRNNESKQQSYKNNSYKKSKGGHSSMKNTRVAKNSSSRTKSNGSNERRKHK